ncbi:MAG TPA: 7-carboxy-7-deazaguanine synthase QueE [Methanosarcinales archaeon]|nr:7-carboxy-7-deazaguanine synthase QueE [Methanosarcinales archaeon]
MNANIYKIFNSVQGEGIYAGTRQVFVRFCGCQLRCEYCDTREARHTADECRIADRRIENPLDTDVVISAIDDLWTPSTRHISLTGGEPLLHRDFIRELVRSTSKPTYLETNAGLPKYARIVADLIDIVSCDIKLPEHRSTGDYDRLLHAELETIEIFHSRDVETFVKIVVLQETTEESIKSAVCGIKSIDNSIPLILQPVTPIKVDLQQLLDLMDFAGEYLSEVRMIPQIHRMIGMP